MAAEIDTDIRERDIERVSKKKKGRENFKQQTIYKMY